MAATVGINEVRLVGRVSSDPAEVTLPSGDVLLKFRVSVRRPDGGVSKQAVDALECAAWTPRARRTVGRWRLGDTVEVRGAVRRRFYRAAGAAASRVEIEVSGGRLVARSRAA